MTHDRGSAAVEMVVLTPVIVVLLLFVVHLGRVGDGSNAVRHAADQGARAASMVSAARMSDVARREVLADLERAGQACGRVSVSVQRSTTGATEWVTVRVECSTSTDGLSLLGTHATNLSASSTEVIDRYRGGD
jgi:Flp pilus assembly protein TadG